MYSRENAFTKLVLLPRIK